MYRDTKSRKYTVGGYVPYYASAPIICAVARQAETEEVQIWGHFGCRRRMEEHEHACAMRAVLGLQ
eukprot:4542881-Pleurochrysis_carterae.AAC.1